MKKRWLYIPIETKVRELHGKVLLASFAAINGFNVVIGSKKDINSRVSFSPEGIVINFGLARNFGKNAKKYKKYGHKIAAIDEEGLVTLNDDLYLRHRVSKEALDVTDVFFCWGEKQLSIIKKKFDKTNCKIFVTGNPRIDLLRPEYIIFFREDAENINKKYGKFILINTNFGHGNHFIGDDFLIKSFKEKGWMEDPRDKEFFLGNMKWHKKMFKEFKKIIPELSEKFKDHKIIIRPHPSENHNSWKEIAKKYENVLVVHSGNVIPWLIAADVLVHNGCTTAVEAFLLGTKAVAYRPFIIPEQETELPNKISVEVFDSKGLINKLDEIINRDLDTGDNSKKTYLKSYLVDFETKTISEKIISILASEIKLDGNGRNIFSALILKSYFYLNRILKDILLKLAKKTDSSDYQLHKISDLTKNEIEEIIGKFLDINNDFSKITVKSAGGMCYRIFKEK